MSCLSELRGLGAINDDLKEMDARLIGVSVDPPEKSREVADRLKLPFPLLSDSQHELIAALGLVHKGGGPDGGDIALPAQVLVDPSGRILWEYVAGRIQSRLSEGQVLEHVRKALNDRPDI